MGNPVLTFPQIERKIPVLRPAFPSNQSSLCSFHNSRVRGVGGPSDQVISIKKIAPERRQKSRKIINEKRENNRAKNGILWNNSTDSKGATFVILKNNTKALVRKERLSPTSKARKETSRNKFMEKGGLSDRVESLREVDRSKNCPGARLGFVKPIRNGLKVIENLIEGRPSSAEADLAV